MLDRSFGIRVAASPLPVSGPASAIRPGFVVAIPVRDEEERLPACLGALALQRDRLGAVDSANAGSRCRIRQQLHRSECKPRSKARTAFVA